MTRRACEKGKCVRKSCYFLMADGAQLIAASVSCRHAFFIHHSRHHRLQLEFRACAKHRFFGAYRIATELLAGQPCRDRRANRSSKLIGASADSAGGRGLLERLGVHNGCFNSLRWSRRRPNVPGLGVWLVSSPTRGPRPRGLRMDALQTIAPCARGCGALPGSR
jgi:hypothetical protein